MVDGLVRERKVVVEAVVGAPARRGVVEEGRDRVCARERLRRSVRDDDDDDDDERRAK